MIEPKSYAPSAVEEARLLNWLLSSSWTDGFSEHQMLDRVSEHGVGDVWGAITALRRRGIVMEKTPGSFIVSQVAVESGPLVRAELWLTKISELVASGAEKRRVSRPRQPKRRDPSIQGLMPPSWR